MVMLAFPMLITAFLLATHFLSLGVWGMVLTSLVAWMGFVWLIFKARAGSSTNQNFQTFYNTFDSMVDFGRKVYSQSEKLNQIAISELSAVQASAVAVDEISSMLNKTIDATDKLAVTSKASKEQSKEAAERVANLNQMMLDVRQLSHELSNSTIEKLSELKEVSDAMVLIRSKTSVINEIVFQTKLLSFNASVEAARAGESGKGFAVVAEEMGKLARTSGQAAIEIETIVSESIQKTEQRFKEMSEALSQTTEHTTTQLEQASLNTEEVAREIQALAESFELVDEMAQQITAAASEQGIGVKGISKALHQLTENSSKLEKVAKDALDTAIKLSEGTESSEKLFWEISDQLNMKVKKIEKPFDFDMAANGHMDWKMKLTKYLSNPNRTLDPDHVCKDDQCTLGKWIYGTGEQYQQSLSGLYYDLKGSHAEFHKSAGDIISFAHAGDLKKAESILHGSYLQVSDKTIGLIEKMKDAVEKQGGAGDAQNSPEIGAKSTSLQTSSSSHAA